MPARLKTRGWDHSTRRGPLQLHFGVIDIGPHDLPLGKRWRPLQPGALEGHYCRATRAVAHDEIGLEIEWFRGEAGPYYRRSWKLIFVGQIRGGVRLGAPMRGNAPSTCVRRLLEVEPYESNVSAMAMRVALRHFLLDREGDLYRLPSAALDRMLQSPTRHRLPRLAGERVRSAEVAVEMLNGRPLRVPPLRDRHVRAHAELALALGAPARHAGIAEASTRFVARGGQWTPSAAVVRRIEQTALGRQKCPRISPTRPGIE